VWGIQPSFSRLSSEEGIGVDSRRRLIRLEEARRLSTAEQSASNDVRAKPRLVVFYSPTSGRCRRLEALLANILRSRRNYEAFEVVRVDIGERPDLAERFRIEVVPTLLVIEGRRVVRRIISPNGVELEGELARWLV
jgi:thioredoxin-like negative regulator of GroEL